MATPWQRGREMAMFGREAAEPSALPTTAGTVSGDRERLDAALRQLDADIAPMLATCPDMARFWQAFDRAALDIQIQADHEMWHAAAELDRMLVRHGLIPRLARQAGARVTDAPAPD